MILTTAELVYINEAAKALKQKDFMIIGNIMIGLDNIQNILSYISLDSNFITNYIEGAIINARALSAFIKSLSLESDFKFDYDNCIIRTISGGELCISFDNRLLDLVKNKYAYGMNIDKTNKIAISENQIDDIAKHIQTMNKADGGSGVNYNGYYMVLFPSILPMNKSDKMYVTIFDFGIGYNTFIAKFRINKKKFDIITYIHYIKL